MSTKKETKSKDYFTEYKELGQAFFEKIKAEYLVFIEKSRDYNKIRTHNEYKNEIYQNKEREINTALGSRQSFFSAIKHEYDNNKTKKYSDIFNEKFNEIPEGEKSKMLKLLAEKRAWHNMYNFWVLMGDYYNKRETLPLIELIISAQPELANFFDTLLDQKKNLFLSKLKTRTGKEEQLAFAKENILKLRENIEGDSINDIYNFFTQTLNEILSRVKDFGESFLLSKKLFPQEFPLQSQDFNSIIEKGLINNIEFNEEELSKFFNELDKIGFKSGLIETAAKSEDKKQALLYVLLYFHYEKTYLNILIEQANELSQSKMKTSEIKEIEFEKFEWLGTQKQLGELFIELERKGWIKELRPNLIKNYFTTSNTIEQILKPSFDKSEKTYSGIFTKAYKRSFNTIKPNITKPKKINQE